MRRFPAAGALPCLFCLTALLCACGNLSPAQQAQITQALMVACNVDGAVVPIAQPVVAALGPGGATAVSLDNLLLHPAVVQACAALNGTPASATPAGVSASPAN